MCNGNVSCMDYIFQISSILRFKNPSPFPSIIATVNISNNNNYYYIPHKRTMMPRPRYIQVSNPPDIIVTQFVIRIVWTIDWIHHCLCICTVVKTEQMTDLVHGRLEGGSLVGEGYCCGGCLGELMFKVVDIGYLVQIDSIRHIQCPFFCCVKVEIPVCRIKTVCDNSV